MTPAAMGPCVVDASTALKWVLDEVGSDAASALLDGRPLFAPALLRTEVANALWSAARRGRLSAEEAADALDLLLGAPVLIVPDDAALHRRALELAHLLDHPVYDCFYLAVAMARGAPVITADDRFVRAAGRVEEAATLVQALVDAE